MRALKRVSIIILTIILMLILLNGNAKATTLNSQLPEEITKKKQDTKTNNKPDIDIENYTIIDIVINKKKTSENSNENSKDNLNKKSNENLVQISNEKSPVINKTQKLKIDKEELESCKLQLASKVKSDYDEASWKNLQNAILAAEKAETIEEYDNIKSELNLDKLVPINFEKQELNDLLKELESKSKRKYTKKSWEELQQVISTAENAKVESEYNNIKNKLTIGTLKEKIKTKPNIDVFPIILLSIAIGIMIIIGVYGKGNKVNTKLNNNEKMKTKVKSKAQFGISY